MADYDKLTTEQLIKSLRDITETQESNTKNIGTLDEFRKTFEERQKSYDEMTEEVKKINEALDAKEKAGQEALKKSMEDQKKQEESIKALEEQVALYSKSSTGGDYKDSTEYKAVYEYMKKGLGGIDGELQKALLSSDNNESGGYLVSMAQDSTIQKILTEFSPMRSYSRVISRSEKTFQIPMRTKIPEARYEGEADQGTRDNSEYALRTMTAKRLSVTIPATKDILMETAFNIEAEITSDAMEALAKKEGEVFLRGLPPSGVQDQPQGLLQNPELVADPYVTATANVISGDDIMLIQGELKDAYRPYFFFNRRTLAKLRTLKGSNGQYLWADGLNSGGMPTIAGSAYVIMPDMPDIGSNEFAVVYGDLRAGFTIYDRTGLFVYRDEMTMAPQGVTLFTFNKYNTSLVINSDSIKLMKVK